MFASVGLEDEREKLIELYLHLTISGEVLFDRVLEVSKTEK